MARRRPLSVWMYDMRIAQITTTGRPYDVSLRYTGEALDRFPGNLPLLSCSLPLTSRKLDAKNYFRGLLPEGRNLQALSAGAGVSVTDLFGLLERYGRDVAGAVTIIEGDEPPPDRPGDAVAYDADSLEAEVADLEDRPLGLHDDSELSLPGLQNKLLLIAHDGGWARPAGGRPSTHILKVEDRRYPGLVTMEAAAMTLARRVGLTTVDVAVETFAEMDCIIVERFDRARTADDGIVERVHQEDICQAADRNHEANRGRAKYEAGGGPGLDVVAALLDLHSSDPDAQLRRLAEVVTFNVVIGNADAHAKNIALLHHAPGVIRLAPLYDTVPTRMWDKLPGRAAMWVNGRRNIDDIGVSDVAAEAARWPSDPDIAAEAANDMVKQMLGSVDGLPGEFADHVGRRAGLFLDR